MSEFLCRGFDCTATVDRTDKLCDACWAFRSTLRAELVRLWVLARAILPPGARRLADGDRHAVTLRSAQTPINLTVLDAVENTVEVTVGWARILLMRDGQAIAPLPRPGWPRLAYALQTCESLESTVAGTPTGTDYYNSMRVIYRRLVRLAGDARDAVHLPEACRECDSTSLVRRNAGEYVQCLTCGAQWGEAVWHALHPTPPARTTLDRLARNLPARRSLSA